MTRKNILSLLTAGAMGITCFSMNISAESAYAAGDVDMDGVVTGHDTAMVSRYLQEEDYTLTEEQLVLADVDADGEVTQADADKLYNEMQVYVLGDVTNDDPYSVITLNDPSCILNYYSYMGAGVSYNEMNAVEMNLADMNLDGVVDITDSVIMMGMYAVVGVGLKNELLENGIYYYSMNSESPAYVGDMFEYSIADQYKDGCSGN